MTNDFVELPLKKRMNRRNIYTRLDELEAKLSPGPSARVDTLDETSGNTGTLIVDNLIVPAPGVLVTDPTSTDFTGSAITGGGTTFGSNIMHIFSVAAGVLQAGFSTAGKFLAAAGDVSIDENGITLVGDSSSSSPNPLNAIKWVVGIGQTTFFFLGGGFPTGKRTGMMRVESSQNTELYIQSESTSSSKTSFIELEAVDSGASPKTSTLTVDRAEIKLSSLSTRIIAGFFGIGVATNATIATGAITATSSYVRVDTEASAATDDLDTINGGQEGDILVIRTNNNARDVTVKDATGNINLAGGDFLMDTVGDRLTLLKNEAGTWLELARSNNA